MTLRKTTFSRNTVMLNIYIFWGGGVGGGVGCGNVPIKNNANSPVSNLKLPQNTNINYTFILG